MICWESAKAIADFICYLYFLFGVFFLALMCVGISPVAVWMSWTGCGHSQSLCTSQLVCFTDAFNSESQWLHSLCLCRWSQKEVVFSPVSVCQVVSKVAPKAADVFCLESAKKQLIRFRWQSESGIFAIGNALFLFSFLFFFKAIIICFHADFQVSHWAVMLYKNQDCKMNEELEQLENKRWDIWV